MAGERYARLEIGCITPAVGDEISIWLSGSYQRFVASGQLFPADPEEFYIQTRYDLPGIRYANAVYLMNAIQERLEVLGKSMDYTLTADYLSGSDIGRVTITAARYDTALEFQPVTSSALNVRYSELARLTQIRPVIVTPLVTLARCFGSATASISLLATNGTTGDYTYQWADGVTTKDRLNLPARTYTVTVTDASGASTTVDIPVGQNSQIVLEVHKAGDDITLVPRGGVAPYTFLWSDGATTAERKQLPPGEYSCKVYDSLGCGAELTTAIAPSRFYFSHDPIVLALDAGDDYRNDPTTKPELSFVVEVFVEREYLSGEFALAGQAQEQPADRDGRTVFEVQELLEPFVEPTLPSLDSQYRDEVQPATNNFKRFYLRYRERTTSGLADSTVTTEMSYLVYGGLSFEEASRGTWFNGYFERVKPFLTWEPGHKSVLRNQPEYLYFMVNSYTTTAIKRWVKVYFQDGTNTSFAQDGWPTVQRYEVYIVPFGFDALQLGNLETSAKHVVRWEAWVSDQNDGPVSEVRTYKLDRRYHHTPRFFWYVNSLGGVNTLATFGRAELQVATKTTSSARPRIAGYDAAEGDVEIDRKTGLPTLKVSTSARSKAQTLADQDFMLSPRVVLFDTDRLQAGTVKDKTYSPLEEDETRLVLSFDFELPRQRHYSPRLTVPTSSILIAPQP
ncbi:SprB repeat-containing protein [Hymenobacter sp. BT491]|uniref:SprB repeat-containing protein n=1 Tax=Hymenobacter sp. BT491 TaxID=2766779 RepID=UPI0016539FEE|nr:SprB repeat-containing protein [Hymenobacter sp. BT491]MBC6988575.1 SprB repeat-containing protein [Hymenobacter sp. BT491]